MLVDSLSPKAATAAFDRMVPDPSVMPMVHSAGDAFFSRMRPV